MRKTLVFSLVVLLVFAIGSVSLAFIPPGQQEKDGPPGQEGKDLPPGLQDKGIPPGLQDKGDLPPGLQGRDWLPPGIQMRFRFGQDTEEVSSIEITGAETIIIPENENENESVTEEYTADSEDVVWSISKKNIKGVTIDKEEGTVTVTDEAEEGSFTVEAATSKDDEEITGELKVTLLSYDDDSIVSDQTELEGALEDEKISIIVLDDNIDVESLLEIAPGRQVTIDGIGRYGLTGGIIGIDAEEEAQDITFKNMFFEPDISIWEDEEDEFCYMVVAGEKDADVTFDNVELDVEIEENAVFFKASPEVNLTVKNSFFSFTTEDEWAIVFLLQGGEQSFEDNDFSDSFSAIGVINTDEDTEITVKGNDFTDVDYALALDLSDADGSITVNDKSISSGVKDEIKEAAQKIHDGLIEDNETGAVFKTVYVDDESEEFEIVTEPEEDEEENDED